MGERTNGEFGASGKFNSGETGGGCRNVAVATVPRQFAIAVRRVILLGIVLVTIQWGNFNQKSEKRRVLA